eukprot:Nitzschia sp. Nitz4//scaffold125_size66327//14193//15359//NITZ4_006126-RA/size66327-processed-gene-0.11-mRNA-1//1//CDS//3329534598//844//frame0
MKLLHLLFLALTLGVANAEQRNSVSITYEFQLEVGKISIAGTTEEVLTEMDSEILGALQPNLPTLSEETGLPLVQFESINSEIFSACFTNNDECSLVRSTMTISFEGDKPEHSVVFVSLRMVQDYLNEVSDTLNSIWTTFTYPSMVSSLAQFQMKVVHAPMNDTEKQVLEETFEEVFGAIIFAMEGDTEVAQADFLYQNLLGLEDDVFAQGGSVLSTDMQIAGYCRDCSADDFETVVVNVIEDNMAAFRNKLILNSNKLGSTYFDTVESITFDVPELPTSLPPIGDLSIFDEDPPQVKNRQPWFLWVGMTLAICVIGFGGYGLAVEDEYEKDDQFSTSESEGNMSGFVSDEEGIDDMEENSEIGGPGEYEVATASGDDAESNYEVLVL